MAACLMLAVVPSDCRIKGKRRLGWRRALRLWFPGQRFDSSAGLNYNYLRDGYEAATGRYSQPDPIGLKGGLNLYGYVAGNSLVRIDPYGLQSTTVDSYCVRYGAAACAEVMTPTSPSNLAPAILGTGIAATIWCWFAECNVANSSEEGGLADGPAPYDHYEENAALSFMPDPFGGDEACKRLAHAIRVLRAQVAWRRMDLNPRSASYQGHSTRIALLSAALAKLESSYRNICGGNFPG
jgi:RHS repeat-associated protein